MTIKKFLDVQISDVFGVPVKDYFSYLGLPASYSKQELYDAYERKQNSILDVHDNYDVQRACLENLNEALSVLDADGVIPALYERQLAWQKAKGSPSLYELRNYEGRSSLLN
jgi:hypothetical protein